MVMMVRGVLQSTLLFMPQVSRCPDGAICSNPTSKLPLLCLRLDIEDYHGNIGVNWLFQTLIQQGLT